MALPDKSSMDRCKDAHFSGHGTELSALHTLFVYLKQVWPLLLGNVLQWYEFGVYGYLSAQMMHNFFPGSEVATWLGYAVTFVGRPLGGLCFGWIADRYGRRCSTVISLCGMLVSTVGQGLLPTKSLSCGAFCGGLKVVLLVSLRSVQGLCTGGEEAAILPFLAESSPQRIKCLAASLFMVTAGMSFFYASGIVLLLDTVLTKEQMFDWGWRLPFVVSIFPGVLSLWGRRYLSETAEFTAWKERQDEQHKDASITQAQTSVCSYWKALLVLFFSAGIGAISFYQAIWCTQYVKKQGLSAQVSLGAGALMQLVIMFVAPLTASFIDKLQVGPFPSTLIGSLSFTLLQVPLFKIITANPGEAWVVVPAIALGYGGLVGVQYATLHLLMVDMFPTEMRARAFGLTFNSSYAIFGGFVSVISEALVRSNPMGPAYYTLCVGIVSTAALLWMQQLISKGEIQLQHFPLPQQSCADAPTDASATV